MKVFIVEDEPLGLDRLVQLIRDTAPELNVIGHTDSIKTSVQWLRENPAPDLIFMDIELADGQCFEIFQQTEVGAPVIFTTSYDEFALDAFKVNGVDYLLKPIRKEDLQRALDKLQRLKTQLGGLAPGVDVDLLLRALNRTRRHPEYRQRFLVKHGQRLIAIETSDVAYFVAEGKICWLKTWEGRRHLLDYTLEQLGEMLDPAAFYRVNRGYLVNIRAIKSIQPFLNGKLILQLEPATEQNDVVVSKEKAGAFKLWMGK